MTTSESLCVGLVPSVEQCKATRSQLLALLGDVTSAEWERSFESARWTIAQHADHLVLAEISATEAVRRLIAGDSPACPPDPATPVFDSGMTAYPYGAGRAPRMLEPSPKPRQETMERLHASHGRFIQELRGFQGPDPDGLAAQDPATGAWFTLAGWVRLQTLHEIRHILQMKRLLAQPELLVRAPGRATADSREG